MTDLPQNNNKHKTKIGILGGTFNPIHYGHLIIGENACCQYDLERVIYLPTGPAPHKAFLGEEMTYHRCNMVRLAIENNPHFDISYYEAKKKETCYTCETLEYIHEKYPDTEVFLIIGADSLFDFDSWRNPADIIRQATILAAVRDHLVEKRVDEKIRELSQKYNGRIFRLETPNFNVSGKKLRERVRNGKSIRYMVPQKVEEYIYDNKLYLEKSFTGDD